METKKKTLSNKEINALSNVIINQTTTGNTVRLFYKRINSDEYEFKTELIKFVNSNVIIFVNCNFEFDKIKSGYDGDSGFSTESLTLNISESSFLNLKEKLDLEGFGFLLELESENGKNN